jgi:pimeloyl-ACP methyl ester carboxylesterase
MLATINGFNLYYDDMGNGTALLCLHAFPFDHRMYAHQFQLSDAWRLIVPDFRGIGRSGVPPGPYSIEMLADDMFTLLDELKIDKATVMGVSMGGYVAFAMYRKAPQRIAGLILSDTRSTADDPAALERRTKAVQGLAREGSKYLLPGVRNVFGPTIREKRSELISMMENNVIEYSAEGLSHLTRAMAERPDQTPLLPQIAVPTLVLAGEEDPLSPPDVMKEIASKIPHAQLQHIPLAGHLPPLERPDIVTPLLREFLKSL